MTQKTFSNRLYVLADNFLIKTHISRHHPQQLLRHLPAFQTHNVILHIVPGKEVHTAIPDDFLIDHSKMLAGFFGILNLYPRRPKAFQ